MSLAGDKIATRFRDRQGREYVHVRTVPSIAASPRERVYDHRQWLRSLL
jgi:hypothetical protein